MRNDAAWPSAAARWCWAATARASSSACTCCPRWRGGGRARRCWPGWRQPARERGCRTFRLETGIHQHEALAFYAAPATSRRGRFGDYPPTRCRSSWKSRRPHMSPLPRPWFTGDATALAQAIVRRRCSATAGAAAHAGRRGRDRPAAQRRVPAGPDVGLQQAAALDAELAAAAAATPSARALLQRRPFFGVPLLLKDVGPATAHRGLPSRMGSRLFPTGAALAGGRHADAALPGGRLRALRPQHQPRDGHERQHRGRGLRRPHAQPLEPRAFTRRLQRRRGRGHRQRHGHDRPCQRRRRLDPHPGLGLRADRPEAVARADAHRPAGRRRLGRADHRPRGVAQRARLRACARRHRRQRRRRALRRAGAARQLRSRAGRRAARAAHRRGQPRSTKATPVHPEVAAAISAFADQLQRLGHHVEPPRWTSARTTWCTR
jgi:hypothetical protein